MGPSRPLRSLHTALAASPSRAATTPSPPHAPPPAGPLRHLRRVHPRIVTPSHGIRVVTLTLHYPIQTLDPNPAAASPIHTERAHGSRARRPANEPRARASGTIVDVPPRHPSSPPISHPSTTARRLRMGFDAGGLLPLRRRPSARACTESTPHHRIFRSTPPSDRLILVDSWRRRRTTACCRSDRVGDL
jgi:hypothetical protein